MYKKRATKRNLFIALFTVKHIVFLPLLEKFPFPLLDVQSRMWDFWELLTREVIGGIRVGVVDVIDNIVNTRALWECESYRLYSRR